MLALAARLLHHDLPYIRGLAARALGLTMCKILKFWPLCLQMLALTARLRYHHQHYIRGLAAQALGLLFRHASSSSLRAGVRAVLAEAAARPASRIEPAGQVRSFEVRYVD